MVNLASLDFVAVDFTCRLKWSSGLSGSALKVAFADEELDFIGYISDLSTDSSARTQEDSRIGRVSRAQAFSIEDQFVDAVRGVFGSEPVWSTGPAILPRRAVKGDLETAEFVDSSYMTRATYNLRANDLIITLRNGEILRVAPISVEYWDRLLGAPSKGRFFLEYIKPCHNVERINAGWLRRVYDRFKSRLQIM